MNTFWQIFDGLLMIMTLGTAAYGIYYMERLKKENKEKNEEKTLR